MGTQACTSTRLCQYLLASALSFARKAPPGATMTPLPLAVGAAGGHEPGWLKFRKCGSAFCDGTAETARALGVYTVPAHATFLYGQLEVQGARQESMD
jgi:hypothetical protein